MTTTTLGAVLAEARLAMIDPDTDEPMTQVKLADILGISRWTLNRVENGHAQFQNEWLPLMPSAIRTPVVQYLQQRHIQQVEALGKWLPPDRVRRPTGAVSQAA